MSDRTRGQRPGGFILLGIARVARGKADGMRQFGATRESFLASLAPLIAFPLVGGLLMLLSGGGLDTVSDLLMSLTALLAPPVLSFEIARLWRREAHWLRFATAFNWCQWAIPVLGSLLLMVLGMTMTLGLPAQAARLIAVVLLGGYALWLHWFIARHGLELPAMRAAALVLVVNLATVALVVLPRVAGLAFEAK
jgi:hypothetical protein